MKWRPFMPDYYNLFHLAKWNAPQRGLWSGLKTGRLRPQRQMRNRPRVVWEDVRWILHGAISDVLLPGRKKVDVSKKKVLNLSLIKMNIWHVAEQDVNWLLPSFLIWLISVIYSGTERRNKLVLELEIHRDDVQQRQEDKYVDCPTA